MNYAPTIHFAYTDISNVILKWSESCESLIVYQHDADEKVKETHCHILMLNCKYKKQDQLVKQFHALINTTKTRNALWAWEHKDYPNPDINYIKYMTKGILAPVFVKNISPAIVDEQKSRWVFETPKNSDSKSPSKKQDDDLYKIIEIIRERLKAREQEIQLTPWKYQKTIEFDIIVEEAIKVLKEHRKRWNSYDLERYILPIVTDYDDLRKDFIESIRSKIFRKFI